MLKKIIILILLAAIASSIFVDPGAVQAATTNMFAPDSDIQANWVNAVPPGTHYTTIDECTGSGSCTPDVADYISTGGSSNAVDEFSMQTQALGSPTISQIDVYFYCGSSGGGTAPSLSAQIYNGSTWSSSQTKCGNLGTDWTTATWSGLSWNQTNLDNLRVKITAQGTGGSVWVRTMYAIATYTAVTAPTVTTNNPTNITTTGMRFNGNVTPDGGANLTEKGFKYKTGSACIPGPTTQPVDPPATGTFFYGKTGLSVNTQYSYMAYATNAVPLTGTGTCLTQYTLANTPSAPTVDTPTDTSLKVTIDESGNPAITTYAFGIDQDSNGAIDANGWVQAGGTLGASAIFRTKATWGATGKVVTGLESGTTYNFRVIARNGDNIATALSAIGSGTTTGGGPAAQYNVFGWAWSENIGWIKFNYCTDPTNPATCGPTNYGVHICTSDTDALCTAVATPKTGKFIGYAWSEHIGWISFNTADLSGCPSGTCEARLDLGTYEVSGWARVLSTVGVDDGWDGWIKLRGTNYGVSIDTGPTPDEFRGWAWSDVVIGWISFNHLNCDSDNNGVSDQGNYTQCPVGQSVPDYKVMTNLNAPPYVEPGSAITTSEDYCLNSPRGQISIQWDYMDVDGDLQSQYNFQVASDPGFSNIILDYTGSQSIPPGLGPPYGTSDIRVVPPPANPANKEIPYTGVQETRYWRVSVRAATGNLNWSGWEVGPSFTIPPHAKPSINFTWAPTLPAVDELTQFADQSVVYGGATKSSWLWTIPVPYDPTKWEFAIKDEGPPPVYYSQYDQNPQGKFKVSGPQTVSLQVTDSDGFSCTSDKIITSQLPLPEWKEIAPF